MDSRGRWSLSGAFLAKTFIPASKADKLRMKGEIKGEQIKQKQINEKWKKPENKQKLQIKKPNRKSRLKIQTKKWNWKEIKKSDRIIWLLPHRWESNNKKLGEGSLRLLSLSVPLICKIHREILSPNSANSSCSFSLPVHSLSRSLDWVGSWRILKFQLF